MFSPANGGSAPKMPPFDSRGQFKAGERKGKGKGGRDNIRVIITVRKDCLYNHVATITVTGHALSYVAV